MRYLVQYATETDAPALGRVNVQSFQTRQLLAEIFPQVSQPTLQVYKAIVSMKHLADPQTHVLKITDPGSSGDITGYCRWYIPESLGFGASLPALSEKAALAARDPLVYAPRPMNQEVFSTFKKILADSRKKYTTEKDMSK